MRGAGEGLRGAGGPRPGRPSGGGWSLLVAAVVLGVLSRFLLGSADTRWGWFLFVIDVPIATAALALTAGRRAWRFLTYRGLLYGVTNRRALIVREGGRPDVTSIDLDRPDDIVLDDEGNDEGTLTFGKPLIDPLAGPPPGHFELRRSTGFELPDRSRRPKPSIHRFAVISGAAIVLVQCEEAQREIRAQRAAAMMRA